MAVLLVCIWCNTVSKTRTFWWSRRNRRNCFCCHPPNVVKGNICRLASERTYARAVNSSVLWWLSSCEGHWSYKLIGHSTIKLKLNPHLKLSEHLKKKLVVGGVSFILTLNRHVYIMKRTGIRLLIGGIVRYFWSPMHVLHPSIQPKKRKSWNFWNYASINASNKTTTGLISRDLLEWKSFLTLSALKIQTIGERGVAD